MNRGLKAGVMAAPAPGRTLTKEADEELILFLELRKQEKERSNKPPDNAREIDPPLGPKQGTVPLFKFSKARMDEFLNSDRGKNDYDWLLTPPGTPIVPCSDIENRRSPISSNGTPNACSTMLRSRLISAPDPSRDTLLPRPALNSSDMGIRRPSYAGGRNHSGSTPATPTGRPTILAGPITTSRPSTPTSRATIRSKSQAPPPRSSTPVRSSTPTSRPTVSATSNHTLRSTTPARKPSVVYNVSAVPAPPNRLSSSVIRSASTASRSSTPSRGNSATIKYRPVKPADIPGFSLDAPPNLRTSLPDRPSSASRGRPGALSRRSSSVEPGPGARPRRQSCSPSRGRAPNGSTRKGNSVQIASKLEQSGVDVNPIAIGNKMVVHMRKLVPAKQFDRRSTNISLSTKSSLSPRSTDFGRSLSKQSLDHMAFRHMDIRRTIPNNLRPVSASSSVCMTSSFSNSPPATSNTTSSERSVNNNHMVGLDGSEVEEDMISEKGSICSSTLSITR